MTRPKAAALKRKLTELSVRNLKPKTATYVIWDTHQRGLAVRVQPTGSRAWKCVYSFHGRPRWLHLGDAGAIGLADARTLAAEAMLEVARGKDPAAEKRAERGAGTFADLHSQYLDRYAKKRNKSWPQADALVRRHAYPRWAKLQAASIARADVRAMMGRIEAPIVANQTLAAVSAVFSWAVKEEILAANPCKLVERNATRSRERVLSDSEVPTFWSAFDDAGLVASSALKMILLSGQRPGECAHMRREHIVDGWWQMPGDPDPKLGWPGTKNGESHRVWLPKAAQALIEELGDGAPPASCSLGRAVVPCTGSMPPCGRPAPSSASNGRRRMTCAALTAPWSPALGFGREAINRVNNHKEGGIASVYDRHQYASENKRVMEAVAAKIMALATGQADEKVVPIRR